MPAPLLITFVAGASGPWRIERMSVPCGEGLPGAPALTVLEGAPPPAGAGVWTLRGSTSNTRYTNRPEVASLSAVQEGLQRPQATRAA